MCLNLVLKAVFNTSSFPACLLSVPYSLLGPAERKFRRQGGGPQGASWPDCASENLFCEMHSIAGRPDVATRMSSPFMDRGPITSVMSSCSPASAGRPAAGDDAGSTPPPPQAAGRLHPPGPPLRPRPTQPCRRHRSARRCRLPKVGRTSCGCGGAIGMRLQ